MPVLLAFSQLTLLFWLALYLVVAGTKHCSGFCSETLPLTLAWSPGMLTEQPGKGLSQPHTVRAWEHTVLSNFTAVS